MSFSVLNSENFCSMCSYLNNWDKKISNLDVADDYRSERSEIHKAQGKDFPFSFGDVSSTIAVLST